MHARKHKRCPVLVLHARPRDNHHQQQAEGIDGDVPFATGDFLARIVAITGLGGHRSTLVYDAAGQNTAQVDPLAGRATIAYNADGSVTRVENPLAKITTYLCKGQAGSIFDERGYGFCLPASLAA